MKSENGPCIRKDTSRVWILHVKSKHSFSRFTIWAFFKERIWKLFLTRGYTLVKISGTQHYLISRLVHDLLKASLHMTFAVLFLLWFLVTAMLWVFYCKSHLFAANTVRCIWCRFPVTDWWLLMHGNSGKFKSTVILQ